MMKLLTGHADSGCIADENVSTTTATSGEEQQAKPYYELFVNPNVSKFHVSPETGSDDLLMAVDTLCEMIDSSDDDVFVNENTLIRSLSQSSLKFSDEELSESENGAHKLVSRSFLRTRKVASRRGSQTRRTLDDSESKTNQDLKPNDVSSTILPSTPVMRRSSRRNLTLSIPSVKAKVDKLVNLTQEKIKYLQQAPITTESGLRTKVLLESALKKLTNNEVSVHSPPLTSRGSLAINIPPSSPRKRSINESLYGSCPSSPPSPASSPIPNHLKNYYQSPMISSSPEPDPGDESTSLTLSDSIKRMKLINNQHFMEDHPNTTNNNTAQDSEIASKSCALSDMFEMS